MRIEQSLPVPTHGVSTLAPRNRPQGFASTQTNFRSDPVNKLTRRPASQWVRQVDTPTDPNNALMHSYERDGKTYSVVVDRVSGRVDGFVDGIAKSVVGSLANYVGTDMELATIEDRTYVLNRDRVVTMTPDTDESTWAYEKVTHVNVASALNYGERVTLTLNDPVTGTRTDVFAQVPDLGTSPPNYDVADQYRTTANIANVLSTAINALPDYTSESVGSSLAIKHTTRQWVLVEIASGQGDRTTTAINEVVDTTDGLPLYAVVGTRITVRPDPTTSNGTYYLSAERIADQPVGSWLEEVVWTESRIVSQPYELAEATMPHGIHWDAASDTFTAGSIQWTHRERGDDDSVERPAFVGNTISTMGYFQKRLVIVSENNVIMTESDDLANWWRQSAVQLLVTDPVSIASSELGTDKLRYLVSHNRDLLVIASNAQFKIRGTEAVTPQSTTMALTTRYECHTSHAPVSIGNSVFFPINYGDSAGLQAYTGERDTSQDVAASVTNHVIGYLKGNITRMVASPNLEMIALTTEGSSQNSLYIYDQYTDKSGKTVQQAWSTWELTEGLSIVDIQFRRSVLTVTVTDGNGLFVKELSMYTRVTSSPEDVYLDDMLILDTDGTTATVPAGYNLTDVIAVRGAGTKYELNLAKFTSSGQTITFSPSIGAGKVYIGRYYRSAYRPTRPFRYDQDGSTITTDRLRVGKYVLSLVDTNELKLKIDAKYNTVSDQVFNSKFIGQYRIGEVTAYTGDWKFPFSQDAAHADAEFYVDNHLGCTIADISWEGQYFQSKQRM